MLRHSGLSIMVDRLLGLVTGFVRGAVVVAVFVLLGQFVQLTQTSWWKRFAADAVRLGSRGLAAIVRGDRA